MKCTYYIHNSIRNAVQIIHIQSALWIESRKRCTYLITTTINRVVISNRVDKGVGRLYNHTTQARHAAGKPQTNETAS